MNNYVIKLISSNDCDYFEDQLQNYLNTIDLSIYDIDIKYTSNSIDSKFTKTHYSALVIMRRKLDEK